MSCTLLPRPASARSTCFSRPPDTNLARLAKAAIKRETLTLRNAVKAAFVDQDRGPDPEVRRDSYDVDDPRAKVFRRVGDGTPREGHGHLDDRRRLAKEIYSKGREKGGRGPIDATDLLVHDELLAHLDFKTGRCDPSYDTLMDKCRLARETIRQSLKALRAVGLISWVRRTVKVDSAGAAGPQRKQFSNAYHFEPSRLARIARQFFRDLCENRRRRQANKAPITAAAVPAREGVPMSQELDKLLLSMGRSLASVSPE